jgi:hypothetical protein
MNFDIIAYWQAIAAKTGDTRTWNQLPPQHQNAVVQSVNMLLMVLTDKTEG